MLRFIAIAPFILIEAFFTIVIGGFIQLLNDVMVFDDAQYLAIGQDMIIDKNYWLDSAWHNTIFTGVVAIIFASLIFFINRYIFRKMQLEIYSLFALLSAVLVVTTIHYMGLFSTLNMLIISYPRW